VLARLPDVSQHAPTTERSTRAAAAGFVDYRIDPPAGCKDEPASARRTSEPHAFQRSQRSTHRMRTARQSPILPQSDPFSNPISLQERLAPVVRFLMLFLLFTAVGTTTLTISGRSRQQADKMSRPEIHPAPPAAAASHQRLEPADKSNEPPIDPLSATGPAGGDVKQAAPLVRLLPKPHFTPARVEPQLAAANGNPLPQVQTTEPPQAVANLPGHIHEAPSRQAHHDDDQSIFH
jgi:hypothetical protein